MEYAMILCAGFGTRLGDLTKETPKPMLKLGDKPIIEHTILHLKMNNIINIIINLHYMADQFTNYLGNGEQYGVNITYSYEDEPLGTAGAPKKVENILEKADTFLVIYGDVVSNLNYREFIEFHQNKKALASIIIHERSVSNSIVEIDSNNKIIKFIERPSEDLLIQKKQNWVNSGIYCFNNKILDYIPAQVKCDFPQDVFPLILQAQSLFGYPLRGYRCAVDSPDRYFMLQSDYSRGAIF